MDLPPDHPVIAAAFFSVLRLRHAACRRSPPSRADVSLSEQPRSISGRSWTTCCDIRSPDWQRSQQNSLRDALPRPTGRSRKIKAVPMMSLRDIRLISGLALGAFLLRISAIMHSVSFRSTRWSMGVGYSTCSGGARSARRCCTALSACISSLRCERSSPGGHYGCRFAKQPSSLLDCRFRSC